MLRNVILTVVSGLQHDACRASRLGPLGTVELEYGLWYDLDCGLGYGNWFKVWVEVHLSC